MTKNQRKLYELALRQGKLRFGSPCRHTTVKNGRCLRCLRKVVTRHA